MVESRPSSSPARPPRAELAAIPARWGFSKGFLTGAAIEIPALAATVWVVSQLGVGDPEVGFMRIMRLTAVFAGIAALFTAGGIGRLAAHASAEGGRGRAVYVAARAHAVASAGLVLIAMIPHGHLPDDPWGWLPIPLAGLVCGALCGALIGAVCGGRAPVGLSDVWWLARKPSEALGKLLGPEDLVRLGAALRTRTTTLFEGMFDPAPPPPPPTDPASPDTPQLPATPPSATPPAASPPSSETLPAAAPQTTATPPPAVSPPPPAQDE